MVHETQHPQASRMAPILRTAGMALAVCGLAATATTAAAGTAGAATSSVVSTTHTSKLGTFLVSGKTVYTLMPSTVACKASCLKVWPEVLLPKGVTKPTAGSGVNAAKLGTVKRSGGTRQLTYSGKPLYWFVGDTGPGQVHGDVTDTWGKWSVVVTAKPAHSSGSGGATTTSSGSGGVAF
jgi:predicted lipoprotein with Yx(FWY)xxD motif